MCEECDKYKKEIKRLKDVLVEIMNIKSCNYYYDKATANVCNLGIIREIIEDVLDE